MTGPPGESRPRPGPAGVVSRSLAAVLDLLVVFLLMGAALLAVAGVRFLVAPLTFRWPSPSWPQSVAAGAGLAVAYLTVAWATSGRSGGAAVLGLRVRSAGGGPLGWFRAGLRATLCVGFPIGLGWALLSRRRRSLQDVLVRSVVEYDWGPASPPAVPPTSAPPRPSRSPVDGECPGRTDQTTLVAGEHGRAPVAHPEFAVDRPDVGLDRVQGDRQVAPDLGQREQGRQ